MPALPMEKRKMTLAMWTALKSHIMKQREKKKQEQEADKAVKRMRREQEIKKKQNAMTLEEMREQFAQYEKKLQALRAEKHEMFLYLKRVLYEDDNKRRNEEDKEANEMMQMSHHYANQNIPQGAPNLFMTAGNNRAMNRNPVMHYKGGNVPPMQNGSLKRSRSPSPPPQSNYGQNYGYKVHGSVYGSEYPISRPNVQYPPHDAKPLPASYHASHMQQPGFVTSMPQQMEQKPNVQEEKYYIQTGGISSGFPIRTQHAQAPSQYPPCSGHSGVPSIQVPLRKEDVMQRYMKKESHR